MYYFLGLLTLMLFATPYWTVAEADHFGGGLRGLKEGTGAVTGSTNPQDIRNGQDAGDFPFFVSFMGDNSVNLCGGTLIYEDIVLTTAACVDSAGIPSPVYIGPNYPLTNGTAHAVVQKSIYPSWNASHPNITTQTNLAVLKLETPATQTIVSALNNNPDVPAAAASLLILGFGEVNDTAYPNQLQLGFVTTDPTCSGKAYFNPVRNICAVSQSGYNQLSCPGDAGGPVLKAGTNTLVGIQSFSDRATCSSRTLNGYARISYSYNWIEEQICALSSNPPTSCPKPSAAPSMMPSRIPTHMPTPFPTPFRTLFPTLFPTTPIPPPAPTSCIFVFGRKIKDFVIKSLFG